MFLLHNPDPVQSKHFSRRWELTRHRCRGPVSLKIWIVFNPQFFSSIVVLQLVRIQTFHLLVFVIHCIYAHSFFLRCEWKSLGVTHLVRGWSKPRPSAVILRQSVTFRINCAKDSGFMETSFPGVFVHLAYFFKNKSFDKAWLYHVEPGIPDDGLFSVSTNLKVAVFEPTTR